MVKLSDLHMHSSFSTDSETPPIAMIQKAISLGLDSICFTDHNDYDYPLENGVMPFQLDFNQYITEIKGIQKQFQKQISIYIGVEQGLIRSAADRINQYDSNNDLDFIIGSSHLVFGQDPYYPEFWNNYSVDNAVTRYYEGILDNLSCCHNFDVYGHLDYIIRYAPDQDRNYDWFVHSDLIDQILKELIAAGKGIELNTAGIKYGLKDANPCNGILKRYHELGGEIITIGSDGHKPEHIAYSYNQLPELLSNAGFHYYTVFKNRKPVFIKL